MCQWDAPFESHPDTHSLTSNAVNISWRRSENAILCDRDIQALLFSACSFIAYFVGWVDGWLLSIGSWWFILKNMQGMLKGDMSIFFLEFFEQCIEFLSTVIQEYCSPLIWISVVAWIWLLVLLFMDKPEFFIGMRVTSFWQTSGQRAFKMYFYDLVIERGIQC